MPHDNVTPFRPRPKRPAAPQRGEGFGFSTHRGKAVLVQAITFGAFACNLLLPLPPWSLIGMALGIAGAALAYVNRGVGMPWAATHHEHALRTLIIGYSIWVLGSALVYVSSFLGLAALLVHVAVAIWAGLRAGIGLVLAVLRKPIANPHGAFV